jgi:hypothetical protein
MDNTIENIDLVILDKEYHELTNDEKAAVGEFIADEQEYNDFKLMLTAVKAQLIDEKEIIPNPEIKSKLIADFEKHIPAAHLNSSKMGLVYFFPKEKGFFNKPGVQILMAAAGIALLIGFTFTLSFDNSQKTLAQLDEQKTEEPSTKTIDQASPQEEVNKAVTEQNSNIVLDENEHQPASEISDNVKMKEVQPGEITASGSSRMDNYFESEKSIGLSESLSSTSTSDSDGIFEEKKAESSSDFTFSKTNALTTTTSASAPVTDVVRNASVTSSVNERPGNLAKDKANVTPKKTKSLAENAELISYFYTAM